MTVKRVIETYEDYLAAIEAKKSEDAATRNEAKNALGNFRRRDPERFKRFQSKYDGVELLEITAPSVPELTRKNEFEKAKYIKEHPEIDVFELRRKARARLKNKSRGIGLRYELLNWVSEEEVLNSIDYLDIPDLITASGKPVQRETLIRRCVKKLVADKRFDDSKLRKHIIDIYMHYCSNKLLLQTAPYLYEPLKRMLNEEASVEELLKISDGICFHGEELYKLLERKKKQLTAEQIELLEKKAEKKARRKARKREKMEALKAMKEPTKDESIEKTAE